MSIPGLRMKTAAATPDRAGSERTETTSVALESVPDYALAGASLLLVGIGTVMVYSSSTVIAAAKFDSAAFFMIRHAQHLVAGALVFLVAYRLPIDRLRRAITPFLFASFVLLVAPLVVGEAHKGAQRWISVFGFSFQPSEVMKFALILFLSDRLASQQERLRSFRDGLLPHLIITGAALALIVVEPDLSTAVAIALIAGTIMIAARVRARHLFVLGGGALAAVALLIAEEPYRLERITGYVAGDLAGGASYQIQQGFVAMGSGGVFGRGLGQSLQKYFYLPEPYSDSVYPIIGEEFGLLGTLGVLAIYGAFAWRALVVILAQESLFRFLLATGLAANVLVYAALNIGVMTALLPPTGLPLPFISYGGTSLVFNMAAVGLLLGLSRQQREVVQT